MTDASEYPATDIADAGDASVDERPTNTAGSRRGWWILVLLLLLLLLACGIVQVMFPTTRGTIGKKEMQGMVSVFSIYGLHQPLAVGAGPDGEIAVADTGVQKALLFDSGGDLDVRFGGELPENKVFGVDGMLYHADSWFVADWILRRIWVFDKTGAVVDYFPKDPVSAEFGEDGFAPYDLALLDDEFIVTTAYGLERFDANDLSYLGRFGPDTILGQPINYANGIAVDAETGQVYVCDVLNRRVVAFDREGTVLWSLGKPDEVGKIVSFFSLPRGVTVTDRGVLVSDTFKHQLVLLDSEGQLLGTYGARGVADLQFNFPEGLATASDGLVYIADRENNRVQVVELQEPMEPRNDMKDKWSGSFVKP